MGTVISIKMTVPIYLFQQNPSSKNILNRIGGVMISVLASSVVDRGLESQSGQTIKLVFVASPLSMQH